MLLYLMCSFVQINRLSMISVATDDKMPLHQFNEQTNQYCINDCSHLAIRTNTQIQYLISYAYLNVLNLSSKSPKLGKKAHLILEWWVMLTSRSVTVDFVKKWMDKCVEMENFRIESHRFVYEQNYWSEWRALKL